MKANKDVGCTRAATETCSSLFCSLRLPPSTGAGIFVTTVVAGSVALVKPFVVASRPFLRDVSFYMVAVFWTFLMLFRRTTNLGETLGTLTHTQLPLQWSSQGWREQQSTMWMEPLCFPGYLSLYVVYVIIVIVSSFIYQRQKSLMLASSENTSVPGYSHNHADRQHEKKK